MGTFDQDGGWSTAFEYGEVLPAGLYFLALKVDTAPWTDPTGYPYVAVQALGRVLPYTSTFRVKNVGLPASLPYGPNQDVNFVGYGDALAAVHMGGYA